jgi:hypothetical protein
VWLGPRILLGTTTFFGQRAQRIVKTMEREIQCEVLSVFYCGKKWMTKEIVVIFSNDEITISQDGRCKETDPCYKYYKLEYDEKSGDRILGDGLNVQFDLRDFRARNCLDQLKNLIPENKAKKKDKRRQSGPRNTLTNAETPQKSYLAIPLDLVTKSKPHNSPIPQSNPIIAKPSSCLSPPSQQNLATPPRPTQADFPVRSLTKLPSPRRSQNTPAEPTIILPPVVTLQV